MVLEKTLPLLEKLENWSNEGLFEVLKAFAQEQGFKVGTVMWPIRTALSGQETSPWRRHRAGSIAWQRGITPANQAWVEQIAVG